MKVVLINTSDSSGGAAIACLRLQKALEKNTNISATVLVQEKNTDNGFVSTISTNPWKKRLTWLRFVTERLLFLPYEKSKEIRFLFNRGIVGIDISRHPLIQEADIIHLHWINFGFLSVNDIGKLLTLGKPVVWTFHDMWPFTGGCHHSGDCTNYQMACGSCKFVNSPAAKDISHTDWTSKSTHYRPPFTAVGCSAWLAGRAAQSSLLRGFRIETIPNPLDTNLFKPIPKPDARRALGLPLNRQLILFAAMRVNAPGKGFEYFVSALKMLAGRHLESFEGVELMVFGQADEGLLAELPFPVHRLGRLSDFGKIALAYNAASMFVTPSLEENLPNTIMESFACGTPVVGFKVGGIPEMIDHKKNGYLSEYKSTDSLADGIRWVLENNHDQSLSRNARVKVLDSFSEAVVAKKYAALYRSML